MAPGAHRFRNARTFRASEGTITVQRPRDPRPPAAGDEPSAGPEPEISCRELVEFLDAYVDGEIAGTRRAVFERHLAGCADCRAYLEAYRATVRLSRKALRDEERLPTAAIPEDLVRAILASRD